MLAEAVAWGKPLAGEHPSVASAGISGRMATPLWDLPTQPSSRGCGAPVGMVLLLWIWPWPLPGFRVLSGPYL